MDDSRSLSIKKVKQSSNTPGVATDALKILVRQSLVVVRSSENLILWVGVQITLSEGTFLKPLHWLSTM